MSLQESVSLYCTVGSSDKVYHMQLLETDPAAGKWSVFAQNGRRGSTLVERTKVLNTSYRSARSKYQEVMDEKLGKSYTVGAKAGKSILPAPAAPAAKPRVKLPPMPAWPDFETSYAEAATMLGEPMTLKTDPQAHLVLLVDIAAGAQEGLTEALHLIKKCRSDAAVKRLLSQDGSAWVAKAAKDVAAQAASDLRAGCAKVR